MNFSISYPLHPSISAEIPRFFHDGSSFLELAELKRDLRRDTRFIFYVGGNNRCATRLFVEVSILESIHFDSFAYSFFRDQFEIEKRRNNVRVK